jgi:spore germination protein GerM
MAGGCFERIRLKHPQLCFNTASVSEKKKEFYTPRVIDPRRLPQYHKTVAVQRKPRDRAAANTRKKPGGKSAIYLFWFVFFMAILLLFMINWNTIRDTVNNTGLTDRVTRRDTETPEGAESKPGVDQVNEAPQVVVVVPEKPVENIPAAPPEPAAPEAETVVSPAASKPAAEPPKPAANAPKTVERTVYFVKFDEENGVVLRIKASRTLPVSDSPLLDVLTALLRGPSAAEEGQKLRSLIPAGTRILSATVRGSTAYVNFSEDFQFNSYGIEGYAAQLQQLVWTITEFPNIQDVQFLIEGRIKDYLVEGIQIGSPLSRNNF